MALLTDLLSYAFIWRALAVGTLVALCAALLGVTLVLKRYAMIGDGLSHVGFGALSVATVFHWAPLSVAMPVVVLAAFGLLNLSEKSRIKADAAIALLSSSALALGVTVTALAQGQNLDVYNYLFGSILAVSLQDVVVSAILAIVVFGLYLLLYPRIFAVTFDEEFAQATGVKVGGYKMMVALLAAGTIVVGMRLMGTLLISSLIIFPALTAMRLCRSYRSVLCCAALVAVFCFIVGIVLSFLWNLPTGASVVLTNMGLFLVFWGLSAWIKT